MRPRISSLLPLSSVVIALLLSPGHLAGLPRPGSTPEPSAAPGWGWAEPLLGSVSVASAEHSRVEPSAGPLLATPLRDLEDRAVVLKSLIEPKNPPLGDGGKVLVVLHQDRKSGEQNQDFKDQLGKLTTLPGGRERLHIVALADVGGYDFWPAKGYVKEALRPVQAAGGALVLCDWKGAVRKHYAIRPGQSAVFVVDGAGELRTFRQGLLSGDDASQLLQLIKSLLATPGGS